MKEKKQNLELEKQTKNTETNEAKAEESIKDSIENIIKEKNDKFCSFFGLGLSGLGIVVLTFTNIALIFLPITFILLGLLITVKSERKYKKNLKDLNEIIINDRNNSKEEGRKKFVFSIIDKGVKKLEEKLKKVGTTNLNKKEKQEKKELQKKIKELEILKNNLEKIEKEIQKRKLKKEEAEKEATKNNSNNKKSINDPSPSYRTPSYKRSDLGFQEEEKVILVPDWQYTTSQNSKI